MSLRGMLIAAACTVSIVAASNSSWAVDDGDGTGVQEPTASSGASVDSSVVSTPSPETDPAALLTVEGPQAALEAEAQESVPANDIPAAPPAPNAATEGIYGAPDVALPSASRDRFVLSTTSALEATIRDRKDQGAANRASGVEGVGAGGSAKGGAGDGNVVLGAAALELDELAQTLYPHLGAAVLAPGTRRDLVQAELPRADVGATLTVEVIPQLEDGTIPGSAFAARASLDFGDSQWVEVAFDTSGLGDAFGGDYADRLQFVALPECALTTPEVPGCLDGVPLRTVRGADGVAHVYAPASVPSLPGVGSGFGVPLPADVVTSADVVAGLAAAQGLAFSTTGGGTIIAAVSGADSQSGTFKATDLAPRGTWGVSEPTGSFTYSIPIAVPPVTAGPVPNVSLGYSSQSTDGKSFASNAQASIVGEGWTMPVSYIERLYKPCSADGGAATSGDLCWASPYTSPASEAAYVLSLNGRTEELVWTSTTGTDATYTAASDPTLKVTRHFGTDAGQTGRAGNGDNDGEYFEVKTSDGSVYFFGYEPYGAANATNSIAYEPVIGNNTGEPGYGATDNIVTNQAYRFMLDVTLDASKNAITYFYAPATNRYLSGVAPSTISREYVRDVQLERVEYGRIFTAPATPGAPATLTAAEAKVEFDLVDRCVEHGQFYDSLSAGAPDCDPITSATAASYPDVPADLICTGACNAAQTSPVYFSTVRLNQINTFARGAVTELDPDGPWLPVDTNQLISAFPTTNDGSARSLWLDSVYTRAWGVEDSALEPSERDDQDTYLIKFSGIRLNNRVDWDPTVATDKEPQRALDRMRISSVWTEMGGRIDVTYAAATPDNLNAPGVPANVLCPVDGADAADYVTWIAAHPLTQINAAANTQLCYAAKRGAETEIFHNYVATRIDLVDTVAGTPTQTHTYAYGGTPGYGLAESVLYAPGSAGDTATYSSYRGFLTVANTMGDSSQVPTTKNQYYRGLSASMTSLYDDATKTDDVRLQGRIESSKTTDPAGGTPLVISKSATTYEAAPVGATLPWKVSGLSLAHSPHVVQTPTVRSKSIDGAWSVTSTVSTTYDPALYVPLTVTRTTTDDVTSGSETQCTEITYVQGTAAYVVAPATSRSYEGTCAAGTMTGRSETLYDDSPDQASNVPTRGLVTKELSHTTASESTTATAAYDGRGRITDAWMPEDVGETTPSVHWAYETDTDGTWKTTQTRPLGQVSTSWTERTRGNVVKTLGATEGDWTHFQYDALGLLIAGWAPTDYGQATPPVLATDPPTALFVYNVAANGPTLRSRPVTVTSAQYVTDGIDEAGNPKYTGHGLTDTVRRSYTFLDGWGRTLETHVPASNGTTGRTVTATHYNALGQMDWTSAPFYNSATASVLKLDAASGLWKSALVNPDPADLESYTIASYDTRGRSIAQSFASHGAVYAVNEVPQTTTTAYAGLSTTTISPDLSSTTSTSDVLGRMTSQKQCPAGSGATCADSVAITTFYAYETLAEAGKFGFARTTVTDAESNTTVFESNLAGQRTLMTDPAAGTSTYAYDLNGQTLSVASPAGTVAMEYDDLGRMISRTSGLGSSTTGSSSAAWDYVTPAKIAADPVKYPATDLGLLRSSSSTTVVPDAGAFTTVSSVTYDSVTHRPVSSTVKLPGGASNAEVAPLMGDLAGLDYTTAVEYDALGQVTSTTMPALGGLPSEKSVVGYRLSGQAQTLKLVGVGAATSTTLVSAVAFDGVGRLLSRTYGNGVVRGVSYAPVTGQVSGLSASFPSGTVEAPQTTFVQADSFTRDGLGRITQIASAVPNGGEGAGSGEVTGQCYRYDGFNRLASAWTIAGTETVGECGTSVPTSDADPAWDASATAYATSWTYSSAGRITSIINGAATPVTAALTYGENSAPASGVTSMTGGTTYNTYTYDDAGRQVTRTIDEVATALSWDVSSNLVRTAGAGGDLLYVYDASGQRVAKIQVADATHTGAATGYLGSTELTDADTAVNAATSADLVGAGFITGTRYYAFGGATVAVRQVSAPVAPAPATSTLSLMFGDEQGSAQVLMQVALDASGAIAPASVTDPVSRNAYTPYGAVRGADNLSIDHGWLGQVSDEASTGLVYLNARYYDAGTSRFVSPDPLMNPADPRTLDAFRYADNNPVAYTDATGLCAVGGWKYVGGVLEAPCNETNGKSPRYVGGRKATALPDYSHGDSGWQLTGGEIGKNPGYAEASKAKKQKPGTVFLPDGTEGCEAASCMFDPVYTYVDQGGPTDPVVDAVLGFLYFDDADGCVYGSGAGETTLGCVALASNFFPGVGEVKWGFKGGGKLFKWLKRILGHGDEALTAWSQAANKVPASWGPGVPNKKKLGTRWFDPADKGNGIRVDAGDLTSRFPSQQVDHVVVNSGGRILGPDGLPIIGSLADNPQAHIPLTDWLGWAEWNAP